MYRIHASINEGASLPAFQLNFIDGAPDSSQISLSSLNNYQVAVSLI